jgi:hypothetical protein
MLLAPQLATSVPNAFLNFAGTESFEEVFGRSVRGEMGGVTVHYPSREDLISMKRSASRKQDLADIERLGG